MLLKLPGDLAKTKRAALHEIEKRYSVYVADHLHSTLVAIATGQMPPDLLKREAERLALAVEINACTSAHQIKSVMARAKINFESVDHGTDT